MRALLFVLVLPFASGCSKKASKLDDDGPACPQVVDHMVEVIKAGIKGHDSVNLGDRGQMIKQCEDRKMSAEMRRCMATAKDINALSSCRPANAAPPPDRAAPTPLPTGPVPTAGSAGSATGSGG